MEVPTTAVAGILSTGFLGLGALHLLAPFHMCRIFGLPCSTFANKPLLQAFIYANGGRELMLSIAFFVLGKQRNREGMKALMYGILVAAQVDAYVVWRYGAEQYGGWKGRFWLHLAGGLVVGATAWCM